MNEFDIPSDSEPLAGATNAAEFTVSEISGSLKRVVEDAFGNVRVRGEISGFRGPHSSGHCYFALKDDRAKIDAIIWRGVASKLKHMPEEGLEVIATGKLTTYPGRSSYQIVIDSLEPAGAGALMALLEERKRKLAAEGLFDEARKQLLPYLPQHIGVVTSPTGSVIRDVLHRISDRFPLKVTVWPVRVQGETTGQEVANAISGFNKFTPSKRPDIIIVARGGGSLEDLWGFNDELVVRAAANSELPLISAVGHETDWTLIDLAADMRAPTPTAAAEMAVPVKAELQAYVAERGARLEAAQRRTLQNGRQVLQSAQRWLVSPDRVLEQPRQRLDQALLRHSNALRALIASKQQQFSRPAGVLQIARMSERLNYLRNVTDQFAQRLPVLAQQRLEKDKQKLFSLQRLIETLSHKSVLARGFALVRDSQGAAITSVKNASAGEWTQIEWADGLLAAQIGEAGQTASISEEAISTSAASLKAKEFKKISAKPANKPVKKDDQGTLF